MKLMQKEEERKRENMKT